MSILNIMLLFFLDIYHADKMFFNSACCILLFFYPSSQFKSGKRVELTWREEHAWKIEKKNCRINSDPDFITLATILAEDENKKWCDDSSAGDTVLSAVPLSLMENIYILFPFPKTQCTAFHMKQTVPVKKLITVHIDDS